MIWFNKGTNKIVSAFEVEKSTSIYYRILRLLDLYHSFPEDPQTLFLIISDNRGKDVIFQLNRPSIKNTDLRKHSNAICTLGENKETLKKIAKVVN